MGAGRIGPRDRHQRVAVAPTAEVNQLANLERRTARGGRDSIDHAPGAAHDDIANAVSGVVGAITSGVGTAWMNLIWD